MPPISAILHTFNDGLRLGRALETLRPCDELLVIDHGSTDQTLQIAREYAATIRTAGQSPADPLQWARHDWLLCLLPSESLSEALEATLFEWTLKDAREVIGVPAGSVGVREETEHGWCDAQRATRLIPRSWNLWAGQLPAFDARAAMLQGDLLRFGLP
jgi:glycosyltransferase involved in cell wall biosynthesis